MSSALLGSLARAAPTAPTWGPNGVPYRSGVVCSDPHGSTALASWPSAATGAPAFALTPVTAGPNGSHAAVPAVDAASTAPYTGASGPALSALLALAARHGSAGENADLAAAVLHAGGLDAAADPCLAAGGAGASAGRADALWTEAGRLAGPYVLRLQVATSKLVLGRPAELTAQVTSASGAGVPGVEVEFDDPGPGADLGHASAVTDGSGRAATTVTASSAAAVRAVQLVARARVPGTAVEMSAPGKVSLVAAGTPHTMIRTTHVPIDTTADPHLAVSVDHSVVLPGSTVRPSVSVTGMRGHAGSARLSIKGPLPLSADTGCRKYSGGTPAPDGSATTTASSSATRFLDVHGDGTVRSAPLTLARPGCYLLSTDITTSNAIPNVHRAGGHQIVAVAPVHVSVDPGGHGVSALGRLTADVSVTGRIPAHLGDVQATLVGPARSNDGSCADAHFPANGSTLAGTSRHDGTRLTSTAVSKPGCYSFRVTGRVQIPSLGDVPLSSSGVVSAATLVITPSTSVTGLSAGDVPSGGRVSATVTVSGTWTQPGAVRLELLHLPYDWHGCFDRDWTQATHVALDSPAAPTSGDGTYHVRTAGISRSGCWTVVPVLTMSRNPAISVRDGAPVDPMTAFISLPPPGGPNSTHQVAFQTRATSSGTGQVISAGLGMLALLIVAICWTLRLALRDDDGAAS